MIRPSCFGYNSETALTNAFQQKVEGEIHLKAVEEFDEAVNLLSSHHLKVIVANDESGSLPDSVFPNNWFSTHHNGTVIIYPMQSVVRRKEKRMDLFKEILPAAGFAIHSLVDLSVYEIENQFLEGTGSMVFDHRQKMIYACSSPRTFKKPLEEVSSLLGYNYSFFHAVLDGKKIYHTNVMMAIGYGFSVICSEVLDPQNRKKVLTQLESTGEIIQINKQQLKGMAGNMLMTLNNKNEQLCILSKTAFDLLLPEQKKQIGKYAIPVICNIPVIEKAGGGSIRCMMAEIFLPGSA